MVGDTISSQVVLKYTQQLAEHEPLSNAESGIAPLFLLQIYAWVPALIPSLMDRDLEV